MGKLSRHIYHRRRIKSAKIRTFSAFLEKYFSLGISLMSQGLEVPPVLTVETDSRGALPILCLTTSCKAKFPKTLSKRPFCDGIGSKHACTGDSLQSIAGS